MKRNMNNEKQQQIIELNKELNELKEDLKLEESIEFQCVNDNLQMHCLEAVSYRKCKTCHEIFNVIRLNRNCEKLSKKTLYLLKNEARCFVCFFLLFYLVS